MTTMVEDDGAAHELVARLRAESRIALDVEGDGLFRYRARLCTVQLAGPTEIAVVDTLVVAPGALTPLLDAGGPVKVVHDASFDVRLLRDGGVRLGRLFDTSVAARFLGERATGLSSLLLAFFGIALTKEKQQADWGARPIDEESLEYLADDVRHLVALADALEARVRERGIEAEVHEECEWVVASAFVETHDPRPPWVRIKGALELPPLAQARLRELAALREAHAARLDVPPFKVVRNEILVALATRAPKDVREVRRFPGLERGRARRLVPEIADALARGAEAGAPPEEDLATVTGPRPAPDVREAEKRRKNALGAFRKAEAESRGVDPQVVLPGHCLNDLVARGARDESELRAILGFGECRIERYGKKVLELLSA
jgi:ribonuclease D